MTPPDSSFSDYFTSYFDAWHNLDLERVMAFFADDVVYEDTTVGAIARGTEQMRKFVKDSFRRVPDARFDLVYSFSTGTDYSMEWVMQPMGVRGLSIGKMREGKITENRDYWNGALFQLPDHRKP
jgi:ketosteroid isomerase-like protein